MGFWDDLTGDTAAEASKGAAADTYQKQQRAIERLLGYGDEYAADVRDIYQPYADTGRVANDSLARLLADPSSIRSMPGYQFDQEEGFKGLERSAAARHINQSGRTSKDFMRFATGLADKTYGDTIARLMGGTSLGMNANAGIASGLQGQFGARQTAYGGDMTSAGTIGQGDIAAANAQSAGSQNILNAGLKLAGMAVGAATGNPAMIAGSMGGGSGLGIPAGAKPIGPTGYDGWINPDYRRG